uniref:Uncharacterized protein n=1 Tax=viral metagenome TaxID=1070528 RepID=A0A6C0LH53_9ZZZZ
MNNFGNEFNKLPTELQNEIILKNTNYYQQKVANLLIELNSLQSIHSQKVRELQIIRSPYGEMWHLLNVHENKNRIYSYTQTENAYIQLNNYYKPLVLNLKKEIKQLNNNIQKKISDIDKNKKQYYYYYNKYRKIN